MGCVQSKKDISDIYPNVFRVMNVDESGTDLWSGQLEITETELLLYREGHGTIIWPLVSLRRYGFDGAIFSFESGRRCTTGEGIYAFRCRRAAMMFRALQLNIQNRNILHDSMPFSIPASLIARSPATLPRPLPAGRRASVGQPRRAALPRLPAAPRAASPRSPSSSDILEVMPLYPRPCTSTQVSNIYQFKDFKRENNNNHGVIVEQRHVYSNDLNRELAFLRSTLRQETALNNIREMEENENDFMLSRFAKEKKWSQAVSPTHSTSTEHYAQLTIEEKARQYMNVAPDSGPATPRQPPDYSNFGHAGTKQEKNVYANLSFGQPGEAGSSKHTISLTAELHHHKFSESDTMTSLSPVEEMEVNYAVLDIDQHREEAGESAGERATSRLSHRLPSDSSNVTSVSVAAPAGYSTIDFDKTEALESVASGTDMPVEEGTRKTRHNSTTGLPPSPEKQRK